jgi:Uma2 family endonuclease
LLGTATEADLLAALESPRKRVCELVDGVLVEKPVGTQEAVLAMLVGHHLLTFLETHDLGVVIGADGPLRLFPGLVRIPDVAFVSWDQLPKGRFPKQPIANLIPNLAVEVLSPSNTKKEMERKRKEYFQAGTSVVWQIYPKTRTAEVYTSPTERKRVGKDGTLAAGEVLPGFQLALKELFGRTRKRRPAS